MIRWVVIALLTSIGTSAAAGNGGSVFGVGNASCGHWTEARKMHMANVEEQWVAGFLTGTNGILFTDMHVEILDDMDASGLFAWIDNWCSANPLNHIAHAASTLMLELMIKAKAKHY
jgi:hypothetical protein